MNISVSPRSVKKEARGTVNILTFTLLITTVCSLLFNLVLRHILPYFYDGVAFLAEAVFSCGEMEARLMAENLFSSMLFNSFLTLIMTVVTLFLPVAFVSKYILRQSFDECACMDGRLAPSVFALFAATQLASGIVSALADSIAGTLFPAAFTVENTGGYVTHTTSTTGVPDIIVYFLSLCIITPFMEEYVFRGVIFKSLRKYGFTFAAVGSAVFFGLVHGTVGQMVYAFVTGLILALIYEKTGNIKTCIAIHILNNTYSFMMVDVLPKYLDTYLVNAVTNLFDLLLPALAVYGIIVLFSRDRLYEKREKSKECLEICNSAEEYPYVLQPNLRHLITIGSVLLTLEFINVAIL